MTTNTRNVVRKKRVGMRATYKIEKAIGGNTKVDPKSGCRKIKNIGKPKHAESFRIPLRESRTFPILERARMLAPKTMVAHFAPSDGWILKGPRSIHLRAP